MPSLMSSRTEFSFLEYLIRFYSKHYNTMRTWCQKGSICWFLWGRESDRRFQCSIVDIVHVSWDWCHKHLQNPLRVIFTLEDKDSDVLGTKRIQSNYEARFTKSFKRNDQGYFFSKSNFKKINEFAESAWTCRAPNISKKIVKTCQNLITITIFDILIILLNNAYVSAQY